MKLKRAKKWRSAGILLPALIISGSIYLHSPAQAHTVVFENGTAVMGHHQGKQAGFEVVHSPTYWSGLGFELMRHRNSATLLAKSSVLLWRGNYPDYQSNLYFSLAAGSQWPLKSSSGNTSSETQPQSGALYQWNAGWDGEDRRIYSMLKFSQTFDSKHGQHASGKLRLGIAPYKAKSEEPAIWGIVEWTPEKEFHKSDWKHEVTPMIRYFYRNALFEIGSSLSGKFTFNYMFHFFN
jgi:hypothetical protein